MKRHLLAVLIVALTGCASSAPKIDTSRLTQIRKGEAKVADVVGRFGRPSVLSKNMDGTQTAVYVHAEGLFGATAFVPLIGALAGSADANVDSVIFQFDIRGVLVDYRITESKAPAPAVASAGKPPSINAGPAVQTETRKPAQSAARKVPAEESNPWVIRGWSPSGWRENR